MLRKDNDGPAKWSKTWPCPEDSRLAWPTHAVVGLNTRSPSPPSREYLLDTQWHKRILVSVFGKFQIETDFAPLAFVCAGEGAAGRGCIWPIFRQSKCHRRRRQEEAGKLCRLIFKDLNLK